MATLTQLEGEAAKFTEERLVHARTKVEAFAVLNGAPDGPATPPRLPRHPSAQAPASDLVTAMSESMMAKQNAALEQLQRRIVVAVQWSICCSQL